MEGDNILPKSSSSRNTVIFIDLPRENSKIPSANDEKKNEPQGKIPIKINSSFIIEACKKLGYKQDEVKIKFLIFNF